MIICTLAIAESAAQSGYRKASTPEAAGAGSEEAKYIAELKTKSAAGVPKALYEYGVLLIHGQNSLVPANRPEGYRLLDQATAKGHRQACLKLYHYLRSEAEGRASTGPNRNRDRSLGTNTEILTEAIKYHYLATGQTGPFPETSDSTKEEAIRRAKLWAEKNGQSIPIREKN